MPYHARWFMLVCLFAVANAGARGSHPEYTVAPGPPSCDGGDPVVCAWSDAGLMPAPKKYAVEALAGYDPGCDGSAASAVAFSLTTPDADPAIDIPAAALDRTVCANGDDPCTRWATEHAASVQIRVKALDPPPAPGRAQNNPFSAWSAPATIAGVCARACPPACREGIDAFLAQMTAAQQQAGITSSLACAYDGNWQAGTISYGGYTATGVLPVVQGTALLGVAYCLATINDVPLAGIGLRSAEQADCAAYYAPAFSALAAQPCDVSAP